MPRSVIPGSLGLALLGLLLLVPPAGAGESSQLRLFVGGTHYRWRTVGPHGHWAECRLPACDDDDWRRGNLDNALGFRLGVERAWSASRGFSLLAGGEVDFFFTEYNLSQRDVVLGVAFATTGAMLEGEGGALTAQVGTGVFASSDGRGGPAAFLELGAEAAVSPAARLRLSARRLWLGPVEAEEASVTLRATPGRPGAAAWSVEMGLGGAWPGPGGREDGGLGRGALWQLQGGRHLGGGEHQVGLLLGSANRESRWESTYQGVPGNQRGREVWEAGAWWNRILVGGGAWELRGGLTARVGEWSDKDAILRGPGGEGREAGVEGGVGATLASGWRLGDGVRLVATLEPVLWPTLDLAELRARLGLWVGPSAGEQVASPGQRRCRALLCEWGRDLGALLPRPGRLDGGDRRALGLSALAVAVVAVFDEPIRDAVQRRSTPSSRDAAESFRPVSFWGPLAGAAALWGGANLAGDGRSAAAAGDALEAVLLTVLVVVPALKEVSGRARPAKGLGATHLRPFSEHQSFPSGEVAQAFALATVAREHGASRWLEGVLWAFAGVTTWSRLELDRHWASDAVAGALVGAAMGRWVVGRGRQRRNPGVPAVAPSVSTDGAGLALTWSW